MTTTAIINLDFGVSIEISTTVSRLENGNNINIDPNTITLYDYFVLEERVSEYLKNLKQAADKNTFHTKKIKFIHSSNNPFYKS